MTAVTTARTPATQHRSLLLRTILALVAATGINLALYAAGRLTGAALSLDPAIGPPNHHLTAFDVAWKTFVPLGLGVGAVMVLGAAVALGTGAVPPFYAHDGTTAALLAGMHTVPGVALVWIGLAVRRASPRR